MVTKHCWNYFYGLIACGAKDESALTIAPRLLKPAAARVPPAANGAAPVLGLKVIRQEDLRIACVVVID